MGASRLDPVKVSRWRKALLTGAAILLILVTSLWQPGFREPELIQIFIHELGHLIILACAVSLVLLVGQIDFGLAGYYFLSVALVRLVLSQLYSGDQYAAGIAGGLLVCVAFAGLGAALGWLISLRQKLGYLMTLALGLMCGALAFFVREAYPTWVDPFFDGRTPLPSFWLLVVLYSLSLLASFQVIRVLWPRWIFLMALLPIWVAMFLFHFVVVAYGGLPLVALVAVGVVFFCYFLLHHTGMGRAIHAVGFNREAARLCGVNLRLLSILVFATALFLVSLASLFERDSLLAQDFGRPLQNHLNAFAACVIGGLSVRGGYGCISHAISGALFVAAWSAFCVSLGFPVALFVFGIGALLMVSIFFEPSRPQGG